MDIIKEKGKYRIVFEFSLYFIQQLTDRGWIYLLDWRKKSIKFNSKEMALEKLDELCLKNK